ncbi:hypothetical protein LCGC14_1895460 [marine sediment metagenome]|uniref:DUF2750 domain-containing protein n=2 Tax=root TaxID=1 RepID=A0A831QZ52_9GAMM|nr:DUF2750 domain-containing protein [Marinobacter antarcticus]HEA51131.1 DUF2750 domain-containing protein [Marinobacter antarcticus]
MSDEQLTSVLEMSGEERYDYFLSAVIEEREIWILINAENRFLTIVSEDDGVAHLPVWPSSEFAVAYAKGSDDLTPKSVSLPDFFKKWVSGLSKDGLQIGVFPGLDKTVWVTEPDELKKDLQDELSNF